jgi:hypothetical protein
MGSASNFGCKQHQSKVAIPLYADSPSRLPPGYQFRRHDSYILPSASSMLFPREVAEEQHTSILMTIRSNIPSSRTIIHQYSYPTMFVLATNAPIHCQNAAKGCASEEPGQPVAEATTTCEKCRLQKYRCGILTKEGLPGDQECGSRRRGHSVDFHPGTICEWCLETTHSAVLEWTLLRPEFLEAPGGQQYAQFVDSGAASHWRRRKREAKREGGYLCLTCLPPHGANIREVPCLSDVPGVKEVMNMRIKINDFEKCNPVDDKLKLCRKCVGLLRSSELSATWDDHYWEDGGWKYICLEYNPKYVEAVWRTDPCFVGRHFRSHDGCQLDTRRPHSWCSSCKDRWSRDPAFSAFFDKNGAVKKGVFRKQMCCVDHVELTSTRLLWESSDSEKSAQSVEKKSG